MYNEGRNGRMPQGFFLNGLVFVTVIVIVFVFGFVWFEEIGLYDEGRNGRQPLRAAARLEG